MKKIFTLILALVMLLATLSACDKKADTSTADAYLSMAQDFLDKNDTNSAIDILNKGYAETKDARLSEKLIEIYEQRDNTETTEPTSTETQPTTAPSTKPQATKAPTTKPVATTIPTAKPTQSSSDHQSTCLAVGCKNLPNMFNLYCSEHACAKSDCTSEKSYSSSFCNSHKCSSIGCDRGRNDSGSYCSEHACAEPNCSREKHYGYASIYCSYHECDDVGCENRRKDYGSYCSEHECADPYCTFKKSVLSDYCLIHDD